MSFPIKTYKIQFAGDAASINHLSVDSINIAAEQALSMWSGIIPITFEKLGQTTTEPNLHIRFIDLHDGALSNGAGDINIGSVRIGNRFFVDFYNERFTGTRVNLGPWDLIGVIAHSIGQQLGLRNATSSADIMYASFGDNEIKRFLTANDVSAARGRWGVIGLGGNRNCNLYTDTTTLNSSSAVSVNKDSHSIQVIGPDSTTSTITASISNTRNFFINAVNLVFITSTPNAIVNKVEIFDGNVLMQTYFLSARNHVNEATQVKEWKIKLGLRKRKKIQTGLIVKIHVQFGRFANDNRWAAGEVRVTSVFAETLLELAPQNAVK